MISVALEHNKASYLARLQLYLRKLSRLENCRHVVLQVKPEQHEGEQEYKDDYVAEIRGH